MLVKYYYAKLGQPISGLFLYRQNVLLIIFCFPASSIYIIDLFSNSENSFQFLPLDARSFLCCFFVE